MREGAAVLEQDAHRQLLVVLQAAGGQFATQLQQFGGRLAQVDVDRIQLLHRRQRFGLPGVDQRALGDRGLADAAADRRGDPRVT